MTKIAVIDDDPGVLDHLRGLLGAVPDCESFCFFDPAHGLRWCCDSQPDLIIVDDDMPDLSGLDFITEFRRYGVRNQAAIVMLSDCADRDVLNRALNLGASDFMRKPVERGEFLARIRNLIKQGDVRRSLIHRADWLSAEVRNVTSTLLARERETIMVLSRAAEYRDLNTAGHLFRMASYCRLIAEGLGLPAEQVNLIHAAAPMHDVGKIGIPDRILLKPGPLDSEEMATMREHPGIGASILTGRSQLLTVAAAIARHHHERFDGHGYPDGLAGNAIPIAGRIAALADVFDALTSKRPYKEAWDEDTAFSYVVENTGTHFDPDCVAVFCGCHRQIRAVVGRIDTPADETV